MNRKIFKPVLETIDSYVIDFQDDDSLSIISCETNNSDVENEIKKELKKTIPESTNQNHFHDDSLINREFKSDSEYLFTNRTSFNFKMSKEKSYLSSVMMSNGSNASIQNGIQKKSPLKKVFSFRNEKPTIKSLIKAGNTKDDCKIEQELNIRINIYLEKHRESNYIFFDL